MKNLRLHAICICVTVLSHLHSAAAMCRFWCFSQALFLSELQKGLFFPLSAVHSVKIYILFRFPHPVMTSKMQRLPGKQIGQTAMQA